MRRIKETSKPQNTQKSTADDEVIEFIETHPEPASCQSSSINELPTTSSSQHLKRKNRQPTTNVELCIEKLDSIVSRNNQKPSEDDMEIFGRYAASQLRNLPKRRRLELQRSIQNDLIDAAVAELSQEPVFDNL